MARYDPITEREDDLQGLDDGGPIILLFALGEVSVWHQVRMSLEGIVSMRSVCPTVLDALTGPVVVVVFRKHLDERIEFWRERYPLRGYGCGECIESLLAKLHLLHDRLPLA